MIFANYALMCLIFGTTFLAIKVGVDAGLPPFLSGGIRFTLAGLLLFSWMLARGGVRTSLLLRKELMLSGLGLTFMTFSTLYWAEQHVTSGIAAMLSATGPIMILTMQTVFMRQAASKRALLGAGLGFLGVAVLVMPSLTFEANLLWGIGCLAILLGETGYAAGTLYTRQTMTRLKETSPIAANAVQMMYGGGAMILLSLFTEQVEPAAIQALPALGSFLYLTVVGSMVGHTLYYWLLTKTSPVFASTWLYVSPMIAMGVGALWYGETISWTSLIGAALILIGVVTANLDGLRTLLKRKTSPSQAA